MHRWGYTPLRCRRCSHRFYRKLAPGEALGLPEPAVPVDAPRGETEAAEEKPVEGAD